MRRKKDQSRSGQPQPGSWVADLRADLIRAPHKYGAVRTTVDGYTFASKAEARRYGELKMLEKAGKIESLELQPRFRLMTQLTTGTFNGAGKALAGQFPVIGSYVADFQYFRLEAPTGWIVEDVKGVKTALYRWKKKHVEAQYGVTITEITRR